MNISKQGLTKVLETVHITPKSNLDGQIKNMDYERKQDKVQTNDRV